MQQSDSFQYINNAERQHKNIYEKSNFLFKFLTKMLNKRNKLSVQYEQFPRIFSRTSLHHPPVWSLTRISSCFHDICIEDP